MATQTRTWQNRVIDAASCAGELDRLYWFVEMQVLRDRARGATRAERERNRHMSACWPGQWVPVVPVAPDALESRHWAELVVALFADANPRTTEFAPALTDVDELAKLGQWYEYGHSPDIDIVCPDCGAIEGGAPCGCQDAWPEWLVSTWEATGKRTHVSTGNPAKTLCGRSTAAYRGHYTTARERRRWPMDNMCVRCWELWEKRR
jgi:hypothetical protein